MCVYIYGAAVEVLYDTHNMTFMLLSVAMTFGAELEGVDEGQYSISLSYNYMCEIFVL